MGTGAPLESVRAARAWGELRPAPGPPGEAGFGGGHPGLRLAWSPGPWTAPWAAATGAAHHARPAAPSIRAR